MSRDDQVVARTQELQQLISTYNGVGGDCSGHGLDDA
jgi:hypothetical protein